MKVYGTSLLGHPRRHAVHGGEDADVPWQFRCYQEPVFYRAATLKQKGDNETLSPCNLRPIGAMPCLASCNSDQDLALALGPRHWMLNASLASRP